VGSQLFLAYLTGLSQALAAQPNKNLGNKMSEAIIVNPIMAAHIFAGIGALTLGIFQVFFMPRGTKEHKKIGWYWALLMMFLALTSLYDLARNGWLSLPAHVFTLMTFILLPLAIWSARSGKIKTHKYCMFTLCGVLVAAFIALLLVPGRLLNIWFLGGG
jgi:uncharacterized membrane protein|tara:strand:- start:3868 stop:4347 length:480 start_codon:yes stop_codon:yes gene_type:complete